MWNMIGGDLDPSQVATTHVPATASGRRSIASHGSFTSLRSLL